MKKADLIKNLSQISFRIGLDVASKWGGTVPNGILLTTFRV